MVIDTASSILELKQELTNTIIAAHFYQKDEVFEMADIVGDSLELAKKIKASDSKYVVFCGVEFMGQSAKILSPEKRIYMPKRACCAMARMIDEKMFENSLEYLQKYSISKEEVVPVAYINCSAWVKAMVGKMDGYICTSSNAQEIITKAMSTGKKVLFVPDRCLGQNIAKQMGKTSCIIGDETDPRGIDIVCFDGFCSVHQAFSSSDIDFYRQKFSDILIVAHPECDPSVADKADFVGSTSQMITYIDALPKEQKIAVATEFNLVKRMRKENTYILSSSKPACPTMNETSLKNLHKALTHIKDGTEYLDEVLLDDETIHYANIALSKMFDTLA